MFFQITSKAINTIPAVLINLDGASLVMTKNKKHYSPAKQMKQLSTDDP